MPTLGDRIKVEREKRDWTQRDVAERAGITQAAIHLYETEQRQPSLRVAKKIAAAFGMSVDHLIADTEALDTSQPPVQLWEELHWPADLVAEHIENWRDYTEAQRLEFIKRARRLYEEQEALQAQMRQPKPAT